MAYPYTRSRARGEVADSAIEPSDSATSSLGIFEGPSVESVEGPESVSTGLAGPVSAPAHSLPAGSPPTLGSHGALGSVGPSHVGVFALRYPSGQADPLDIGGQMSTSSATGIVVAEIHAEREQSSGDTTSRQPSATAAAVRLPPEGPSKLWARVRCLVFLTHRVTVYISARRQRVWSLARSLVWLSECGHYCCL